MRWAPVVFAAVDRLRQDEQEREQRKQRNQDLAAQRSGPRFSGGLG